MLANLAGERIQTIPNFEIVFLLIDKGCDLNIQDKVSLFLFFIFNNIIK